MSWHLYLDRVVPEQELLLAISQAIEISSYQILVENVYGNWEKKQSQAKIQCTYNATYSGEFPMELDVFSNDNLKLSEYEFAKKLCRFLACRALIDYSTDNHNPYLWMEIQENGAQSIVSVEYLETGNGGVVVHKYL